MKVIIEQLANIYPSLFRVRNEIETSLAPFLLLSYRRNQNEATGYTPSMLLTGREMRFPTDLNKEIPQMVRNHFPGS